MKINKLLILVLFSGFVINTASAKKPSKKDVEEFLNRVEKTLTEQGEFSARTAWVQANFITEDTIWLSAKSNEKFSAMQVEFAMEASRYDDVKVSDDMRRKLNILKTD